MPVFRANHIKPLYRVTWYDERYFPVHVMLTSDAREAQAATIRVKWPDGDSIIHVAIDIVTVKTDGKRVIG